MNPALAHALALLASLGIAVVVFVLLVWLWFRLLDVETFGPPITTEPDPIESYPTRIRIAPSITIEPPLPVIVNPLTNAREPSSEIVS